MGFVSVCAAIYDYQPQSTGELEIQEGELLYIIEKSTEDDWWRAKKKAAGEDDEEPEGLIPNNYVEEARPTHTAKALYDYTRQTDEEVSFTEDTALDVYDISDPDWTLVGVHGDFGFAPANYIEIVETTSRSPSVSSSKPNPPVQTEHATRSISGSIKESGQSPAANLARVMGAAAPVTSTRTIPSPSSQQLPPRTKHQEYTPDLSEGEEPAPALPQRPPSQTLTPQIVQALHQDEEPPGVLPSPPYNRVAIRAERGDLPIQSPGGYHLYNISEMVSAMGRRRKLPTTLGINAATGTIMLSPEKSRDGASQEWTADKMTHYSIEGKHVFIELIRPTKSLDLHAGAKDTAEEIVSALGEIAGAVRAEGLKEVIAASSGNGVQRKGQVLYDFMAQGEDEVTVAIGDDVIILDDTKSEEWWNVRRLKNGKEGVMPSSYIEITGSISIDPPSKTGINAGRSTVDQNRLEEERLAKEAARANRAKEAADLSRLREVGPGVQLPQRGSSLGEEVNRTSGRKERRSSRVESKARAKPDPTKTRTWTDHSGTFKVEAQFVGVADGKIHLHKVNGVKIAVPVTKMSAKDLEYVEKVTHESIDEHIPVADLIKMKRRVEGSETAKTRNGASVDPNTSGQSKAPDYDWFDFFLKAGVGVHQCERYSQAMIRDSMDESILAEVTTDTLRTLGLKEGDALKVMKYLDQKFVRNRGGPDGTGADNSSGGIFSGPGGALHNKTGRLRPEANRQTNDVVDPGAFEPRNDSAKASIESTATPLTKVPAREPQDGFEDDAWTVKPRKESIAPIPPSNGFGAPKAPTGALADLSLLDKPLEPTPAQTRQPEAQQHSVTITPAPAPEVSSQPTGANPAFFSRLAQQQDPSAQSSQVQNTSFQQSQQLNLPRQRPQAPQQNYSGGGLLLPPPRPTSAPQNPQHNQFGLQPLQPQLTGVPQTTTRQAPPGQSLDELTAQRMQQQFNQYQLQPQATSYPQQNPGYGQYPNGIAIQQTGYPGHPQVGFQQPYLNGNLAGNPFADPRPSFQPQPTGFGGLQTSSPSGINSILPPALQPQPTGFGPSPTQPQTNGLTQNFQPAQTGFQQQTPLQQQMTGYQQFIQPQATGFGQTPQPNGFANLQIPPVPPLPPQHTLAPLQPQKTGPTPQIKFGVTEAAKKLTPQPTGRRANLAQATAQNPFGF